MHYIHSFCYAEKCFLESSHLFRSYNAGFQLIISRVFTYFVMSFFGNNCCKTIQSDENLFVCLMGDLIKELIRKIMR